MARERIIDSVAREGEEDHYDLALRPQSLAECIGQEKLLAKIGVRHLADPFLVCASVHCQMYLGAGRHSRKGNRAVAQTRGRVLFRGRVLADTYYSAVCGGFSESNENVWPGQPDPVLRGKPDLRGRGGVFANGVGEALLGRWLSSPVRAWCKTKRTVRAGRFRWRRTISSRRVDRLVNRRHKVGHVVGLRVVGRGVSGRLRGLRVVGTRGSVLVQREWPVRKLFGRLNSGMFVVHPVKDGKGQIVAWRFVGGGWGHGVGMCQYGAIGRARAGHGYGRILGHYYTGTRVVKVY